MRIIRKRFVKLRVHFRQREIFSYMKSMDFNLYKWKKQGCLETFLIPGYRVFVSMKRERVLQFSRVLLF